MGGGEGRLDGVDDGIVEVLLAWRLTFRRWVHAIIVLAQYLLFLF